MAQTLYLVRHGETTWNRAGRMQGQRDAPLTEQGVEQARRAGRTLARLIKDEPGFVLVMSPLGRARRSAGLVLEAVAPLVTEIRVDERLKEIGWGRWEGLTREAIKAKEPGAWRRCRDRWNEAPPGGESYAMLCARVGAWLESVAGEPRLIVVAHGGIIRAIKGLRLGLPPAEIPGLETPQDAIFRLADGTLARLPTA